MKALHCIKYGSPDNLRIIELDKPVPKDDEVLIQIHAASVNSYDCRIMRGSPFMVRFQKGLFSPKKAILGADIAGKVEAIGKDVKGFKIGDKVYGCLADNSGDGGFAEYTCAKSSVLVHIPKGFSFEQAAAIPMAAVTALQALRDVGKIKAGQQVLINGASGGVGTFAIRLAKSFGAEVTGVCSSSHIETARSLGADFIIDYTRDDFTQNGKLYDLILDIAANRSVKEYRRSLKPGGICAVAGFSTMRHMLKNVLFGSCGGKKISLVVANNTKPQDLIFINKLLESGSLTPAIDSTFPLDDAANAFRHFETGHPNGKIIISVRPM